MRDVAKMRIALAESALEIQELWSALPKPPQTVFRFPAFIGFDAGDVWSLFLFRIEEDLWALRPHLALPQFHDALPETWLEIPLKPDYKAYYLGGVLLYVINLFLTPQSGGYLTSDFCWRLTEPELFNRSSLLSKAHYDAVGKLIDIADQHSSHFSGEGYGLSAGEIRDSWLSIVPSTLPPFADPVEHPVLNRYTIVSEERLFENVDFGLFGMVLDLNGYEVAESISDFVYDRNSKELGP